ncbi:MAG: acyl-CoA synthetase [Candidatus Hydrogenedentota bacterium]
MECHDHVCRSLLTPLTFLERSARVYKDKPAVIYGKNRMTYGEFAEEVYRFASALRSMGLQKGDRVAMLCPNIPAMLAAHFAVPLAGGVLVCINTRLSPREIAYILDHSGASVLFLDTELNHLIVPVRDELTNLRTIVSITDTDYPALDDTIRYDAFLESGSPDVMPWILDDEMETISINYTSGTTGKPKGVMYSHRGAYINGLGEIVETGMTPTSVFLWTVPMFHCNGWCFTWGVTAIGATHVCLRKVEPAHVWELIRSEGVTHLNGAPVVLISLLNHPDRPRRLEQPLTVTTGGAPPSPTLIEHMDEIGARIIHIYGLTETYGPYTICAPQESWEKLFADEQARLNARQGVPYVAADGLRVVDEQMNDVPADGKTMGEVVMRGNMVMKGYYDDPEATAEAFRGGWFHSGDIAVMHPDGYIELRDRSKDVIISGGENISSIEVEQILYRHKSVLEVAVIGIPHEKWGETPKAFVTLKDGKTVTADDLITFCRNEIAHFKCPTVIEFTVLPKTSTGKIQKYVLREKEWAGHDKRIQGA